MYIASGGTADNTTVSSGGSLVVSSGGTATNIVWTPCEGNLYVSDGGYVTFVSRYSGAYFGGGGHLLSHAALLNGISFGSTGMMYLMSGGTANDTTIGSEGTMHISSGGTANDATITRWGRVLISSGGTANRTTINEGGRLDVYSRGALNDATITRWGSAFISSGGTANNTTVSSGGTMHIFSGGTAKGTTISSGGFLLVFFGGIAYSATVSTGYMFVYSGCTASNATVGSGGIMHISGGTMNDTTVGSGGAMYVSSGGTTNDTTVGSGGMMYVSSGGRLTGRTTVAAGAHVEINTGAVLDFDISCLAPGAEARFNDLSIFYNWGQANLSVTVSGSQANGIYSLANGVSGFDQTVTVRSIAGTALGMLSVGQTASIGGVDYMLDLNSDHVLTLTVGAIEVPDFARGDRDGNGVSDVMFVWTGNTYAHGYWMNGTSAWWSANATSVSADWENLGSYDMSGDGKADAVMVGNVTVSGVKGAYIGYLNNAQNVNWKNTVGNLTGNASGANSIVWYAPDLYALGAWTNGTDSWKTISNSFGGSGWTLAGCGDFSGSGKDSILMTYNSGQLFYAVGIDGSAAALGSANWSGWEVRAIADFAGDGMDDIVLFNKDYGTMVILADGNADNYKTIGQLDPKDWFVAGAGDYNGDGCDDLLVRQYSTGMLGYYSAGSTSSWVEMGRGVGMEWTVIA